MTRLTYPISKDPVYRNAPGFHGFTVHDSAHRKTTSIVVNARLCAKFISAVRKPELSPWLEIDLIEITLDKNRRERRNEISVTLHGEELRMLRDTINAVLGEQS